MKRIRMAMKRGTYMSNEMWSETNPRDFRGWCSSCISASKSLFLTCNIPGSANTHPQPCRELGWCLLPDVNIVWPWLCSAIPLSLRLVRISTWASFSIALRKCCLKSSYFDQSAPTREWGSGKSMVTHCSIREAWCRTGEGMNNVTEEVMKEGWVELAQGLEV